MKNSRTGPYSLSAYMHLILNRAFANRTIILESTTQYSATFQAWTKSQVQDLIFLDIVAKNNKSIHSSNYSCAVTSTLGISILADTGIGVCHTVFPFRDATSGQKIFSGRIMSSTDMGQSFIELIFIMHLRYHTWTSQRVYSFSCSFGLCFSLEIFVVVDCLYQYGTILEVRFVVI